MLPPNKKQRTLLLSGEHRELADCSPRVHYVDCNSLLLKEDGNIHPLFLDGVHPTLKGFELLFSAWYGHMRLGRAWAAVYI